MEEKELWEKQKMKTNMLEEGRVEWGSSSQEGWQWGHRRMDSFGRTERAALEIDLQRPARGACVQSSR